jgi:hypothetical protein
MSTQKRNKAEHPSCDKQLEEIPLLEEGDELEELYKKFEIEGDEEIGEFPNIKKLYYDQ